MIAQRAAGSARVVQASATDLPFRDRSFAAALAVLTAHHWPDQVRGLAELSRVARERVVVLTWDPDGPPFWLVDEYLPEVGVTDRPIFFTLDELRRALGPIDVRPLPIPHDCTDGFLGAYGDAPRRISTPGYAKLADVEPGVARLRRDLADGTWARRHGDLLDRSELDLGYRVVVARPDAPGSGRLATASARANA
jgi:SAM-dependent methyltransferase